MVGCGSMNVQRNYNGARWGSKEVMYTGSAPMDVVEFGAVDSPGGEAEACSIEAREQLGECLASERGRQGERARQPTAASTLLST